MTKEDALVGKVASEMSAKLYCNKDKLSWRRMSAASLVRRLREEVDELERATIGGLVISPSKDPVHIWEEVADVCNFAGMVGDVATRALERGER